MPHGSEVPELFSRLSSRVGRFSMAVFRLDTLLDCGSTADHCSMQSKLLRLPYVTKPICTTKTESTHPQTFDGRFYLQMQSSTIDAIVVALCQRARERAQMPRTRVSLPTVARPGFPTMPLSSDSCSASVISASGVSCCDVSGCTAVVVPVGTTIVMMIVTPIAVKNHIHRE